MSSCFNCETPVSTEDRFCGNCGIALQAAGGGAQAHEGVPSSNDADLLDAGGSSSSSPLRPTGDHSARLSEAGGETPSQSDAAGAEESAPVSQDDYSAELQPTIIESSFGSGGGATAAARAHEPVQSADEEPSASQNLTDESSASRNPADSSVPSQNLANSDASS